jgi:hypothetical protein
MAKTITPQSHVGRTLLSAAFDFAFDFAFALESGNKEEISKKKGP